VAGASALLSGFLPGLVALRFDLAAVMKDGLSPVGAPKARLRTALVLAQIAMSVILLVGTGLVVRSLDAARRVNAGFDASHVAWAATDVKLNGYTEARGRAFYQQLLDNAHASHGVEAASLAIFLPLTLIDMDTTEVVVEGHQRRREEDLRFLFNVVSPGYFDTLRIPLVTGRDFTRQDDETGPSVAIVNEAFANRFWGSSADAIGKRFQAPTWTKAPAKWHTIVGVARNAKYTSLTEDPRPYLYLPHTQGYASRMLLHVRSATIATPLEHVRAQVHALDANMAVLDARMLSEQMEIGVAIFDVTARMLAIIGAVAMALAALGIYGLVAYSVKQRAHEIGIRLAIGAQRGDIARQFLAVGLRLGAAGAAMGFAVALIATQLMASLLFGVSATDPLSFVASAAAALLIALLASLIPAWWGARTDPLTALRRT
jgi:predicted permease